MKIFQVRDLRISPVTIIADDVHHASHTILLALYEGLGHWPLVEYAIAPWSPPEDMAPDILKDFAERHTGGLAHFVDNGWEVITKDGDRTF